MAKLTISDDDSQPIATQPALHIFLLVRLHKSGNEPMLPELVQCNGHLKIVGWLLPEWLACPILAKLQISSSMTSSSAANLSQNHANTKSSRS